nr:hypothetical protein [Tanacetum cinerariifolium]
MHIKDSPKQRRIIKEMDKDKNINLVSKQGEVQETVEHSRDDDDETLAETLLNTKRSSTKDKGKGIMQETELPKTLKKKEMIHMSLDEELAQKLYAEELAKEGARQEQERYNLEKALELQRQLDQRKENIPKGDQAKEIDWNDPQAKKGNNNMQTQTSNTLHNAIVEAGSKDRPPMLAPGWKEKFVLDSEGNPTTATEKVFETYKTVTQEIKDQLNAEAEAVQIILTGIDNDVYSTVDACSNACEMWKAIERLKQEWQRFVTLVKQSQELKNVSYHKLYDILKQHQHEVNEIRVKKLARVANPLALVAEQQPVYHPQTYPTHYNQNFSTRSQQATRNRGKAIFNSPRPIYDQEPSMVDDDDDDETSKDKEIDKLMALISLSFKKIYKPTNNNLRTSSNTSRANQDNSPRIHKNAGGTNTLSWKPCKGGSSKIEPTCSQVQYSYCKTVLTEPEDQTMALQLHSSRVKIQDLMLNYQRYIRDESSNRTVTTSKELDLLFSLMFDELLNGSSKVMSKSSTVSAADVPNQSQHHTTPLNNHTTPATTCQVLTLAPTVISSKNINQADMYAETDQVVDDEFINIFSTPLQDQGETSSRHVDSSNMNTFYQRYPSEHPSINGKRYALVIVDDYSRYTWTHFLKSKDETPKVLIDFLWLVQRGLQAQVIVVRTDKGTEFLNQTLHAYFAAEGIKHQTSVAQTPKQNGVVERQNRTLVEAARTMLSAAKVPLFFWTKAIATACFTQNRSLRWGNLDKMKEKGDECIFVGYSNQSRAYRVFNKRTRVIMESIHVNFDELPQMASVQISSNPVPECQTMALKHDSLCPSRKCQENVSHEDKTVTTLNELDLLFSLMFDELLNGPSLVVSKSSAVPTADESIQLIPRHEKTPYHIINNQKPSVKFFHIFSSVCYIVRDGESLDKMKEKGDECIFVRYSTQSRAYRVFNKRKRVIMESIHVNFDELPQMASNQNSSDPASECQTMALNHDNLSPAIQRQANVSQADRTVKMSNEVDLLFSPMFDELLNGSSKVVSKSSAVSAADAPNQRQQLTTLLNSHTTPVPTCQIPTITPTVISSENITQAEMHAENDQVADAEFINIF